MDPEGGTLDIVVIEADEAVARSVQRLLTDAHLAPRVLPPGGALFTTPGRSGPDVVLVGLDGDRRQGLAYTKWAYGAFPQAVILGYAVEYTAEILAQAMSAGARRVLKYPFAVVTMLAAVTAVQRELRELMVRANTGHRANLAQPAPAAGDGAAKPGKPHQLVVVCSPTGGAGSTTLAVNLAVAIRLAGHETVLVDANISFGSHDVFLKLPPIRSIAQLAGEPAAITSELVMGALLTHSSGLQVLLAPIRPEDGDKIRSEHIDGILRVLKESFAFTVVDAWPAMDARVILALQLADLIIVPVGPDFPAMKSFTSFLRLMSLLRMPMDKITPVLIRADSVSSDHVKAVEGFLKREFKWRLPNDSVHASEAANTGQPFVIGAPNLAISKTIVELARFVIATSEADDVTAKDRQGPPSGRFRRH